MILSKTPAAAPASRGTFGRRVRAAAGAGMLAAVAACGSKAPLQWDPSLMRSADPMLSGVITTFENACIANAPEFSRDRVTAAFGASEPKLGRGMMLLASGDAGSSCRITVRGYGNERQKPTVGDINHLGQLLRTRTGGSLKPKKPDLAGGAQVTAGRVRYNVSGYVSTQGDLAFTVYD